jgi:hypothetical protein
MSDGDARTGRVVDVGLDGGDMWMAPPLLLSAKAEPPVATIGVITAAAARPPRMNFFMVCGCVFLNRRLVHVCVTSRTTRRRRAGLPG